jgi:hypothetical protein
VEASRNVRVEVARGIIEYSEVIQPLPLFRMNAGTTSSTLAVQITRVRPTSISTEPSADEINPGVIFTGRSWLGDRPSVLMSVFHIRYGEIHFQRQQQQAMAGQSFLFVAADENLHLVNFG